MNKGALSAPVLHRRTWFDRYWPWIAAAVIGIGTVSVTVSQLTKDDTPKTPVDAACQMLHDGDTPQQAYDAMKVVLRGQDYTFPDTNAAARASVDRAVARGC